MSKLPHTATIETNSARGPDRERHWLARPSTVRRLWITFLVALALIVAAQLVVPVTGYFGIDGWLGFGAVFGFAACVAMVLFAKGLGRLLSRDDTHYDD